MNTLSSEKPRRRYLAFIGDLVGSREVDDRAALQRRLTGLLEELNERHRDALAAPFRLVGGDEFQALFHIPPALVPALTRLEDTLHPVRATCGVGWGELSTDPGPDVGAMDGPAFHRAREALLEARKRDAWVGVLGLETETDDRLISACFGLIDAVRSRWTDTQRRYVRAARTHLQREVADRYGVAESTVSKSLTAARASAVREAEDALGGFLNRMAP